MLITGSITLISCDSTLGPSETDAEKLTFSIMPTFTGLELSKAAAPESPYGCFLTIHDPDFDKPYRFWSLFLHYPNGIEKQAGEKKAIYRYRAYDDNGQLTRLANCIIPGTRAGFQLVDVLLRKQENPEASRITLNGIKATKQITTTAFSQSGCYDGGNEPNSEGFVCGPGGCWGDANKSYCWYEDSQTFGLPEAEVVCEGDCGGGTPPPPPPSDPDPWEPPDDGGSGEPCMECNPGDDPDPQCDETELVGPDGECIELCESGQYAPDGECLDDDEIPCEGDPLPNPEVTPSGGWNNKGGMYGYTRSCTNGICSQFHDGIDLTADVNSLLYSKHSGTVIDIENNFAPGEYRRDSYGNYVIIESVINGETIRLKYAHLNGVSVQVGGTIYAGQVIGLTGNTGNAQSTRRVRVLPHVHVLGRKVVNGQQEKINPNNYMATRFNSDGTVNTNASTCN